jgi:hypothetical protein
VAQRPARTRRRTWYHHARPTRPPGERLRPLEPRLGPWPVPSSVPCWRPTSPRSGGRFASGCSARTPVRPRSVGCSRRSAGHPGSAASSTPRGGAAQDLLQVARRALGARRARRSRLPAGRPRPRSAAQVCWRPGWPVVTFGTSTSPSASRALLPGCRSSAVGREGADHSRAARCCRSCGSASRTSAPRSSWSVRALAMAGRRVELRPQPRRIVLFALRDAAADAGARGYARAHDDEVARAAARRAIEVLLERRTLFHRSDGRLIDDEWTKLHYPSTGTTTSSAR